MITARERPWLGAYLRQHCARRLRRSFAELCVHGLAEVRALAARHPLLFVANHTSWWDPLLLVYLNHRQLQLEGYALMDAANLRALPFFSALGAFGVERRSPHDVAAGLRYAARRLDRPGRAVWIFPQGGERLPGLGRLDFQPGAAAIARLAPQARVVPLALRYDVGPVERPLLHVSFGPALVQPAGGGAAAIERHRAAQEAAVAAELERIARLLRGEPGADAGFERLWQQRPGWRSRLGVWLLCRATRRAAAPRPAATPDPRR